MAKATIFFGPLIRREPTRALRGSKRDKNDRPTHHRQRLRDWRRKAGLQVDRQVHYV